MYLIVCPLCGPGSTPGDGRVFRGISPWLITLCQLVLSQRGRKWLNLPSVAPHNLWNSRKTAEVQSRTGSDWLIIRLMINDPV